MNVVGKRGMPQQELKKTKKTVLKLMAQLGQAMRNGEHNTGGC